MDNKQQQMIDDVSKEIRKEYRNFVAYTLGEQDVLPEQPAPVSDAAAEPKTAKKTEKTNSDSNPNFNSNSNGNSGSNGKLRTLKKKNRAGDVLFFTVILFLIVVLASAVLQRYYVGSSIVVSGTSMDPTYESGTEVWISKTRTPKRGDVVVLYKNEVKSKFWAEFTIGSAANRGGVYEKLIKRVIALSGDKLWLEEKDGNHVLVIQTPEAELREDYYMIPGTNEPALFHDASGSGSNRVSVPYIDVKGEFGLTQGVLTGATKENPFVVGEGNFFFMGDNRLVSHDSRDLGDLPLSYIIGVVDHVVGAG